MNRLYVVESTPTITGAMADHRLPLQAGQIEALRALLAQELGVDAGGAAAPEGVPAEWLAALVGDLQANRRPSLVIAGDEQPPASTRWPMRSTTRWATSATTGDLHRAGRGAARSTRLAVAARAGRRHGRPARSRRWSCSAAIPVYNAPADLDSPRRCARCGFRVHLGLYDDETAAAVPLAHPRQRTTSNPGAMRAPSTARPRSFSR